MIEFWKPILGYENHYEVSNLGRVRSLTRTHYNHLTKGGRVTKSKVLKLHKNARGYYMAHLSANGDDKSFLVHRLVLKSFIGECDLTIDHINGDKTDNRLINLEYVSQRENNIRYRENTNKLLPIGVYLVKSNGKYGASIFVNKRRYNLGHYSTVEEANNAYIKASNDLDNIDKYHKKKHERELPIGVRKWGKNYQAHIRINGLKKHLGTFKTIIDASEAYNKAKKEREEIYAMS